MEKNHLKELFEVLTPKAEHTEQLYQEILSKAGERTAQRGAVSKRRVRPMLLAAVLVICLFSTTALAAIYHGLDMNLFHFLKPSTDEQAEYLANGAYVIDKQVKNKNGTLDVKQVVGDSNLAYILMDFTAPDDVRLNADRYRFERYHFDGDQEFSSTDLFSIKDEDENDNRISLIMKVITKKPLMGAAAEMELENLIGSAGEYPAAFEPVLSGKWETTVDMGFKDYSTIHQVDESISMFGYQATLKTIAISPISITLRLESPYLREISNGDGGSVEVAPNEYIDNYPITIKYKDGTSETTKIWNGMAASDYLTDEMYTVKTFESVINEKEIEAIQFFNAVISIGNS